MIEVKDLKKSYQMGDNKIFALNGVDLKIENGDFLAIMGPSGSGKSTLAHILGLLDAPDSGSYFLNKQLVSSLSSEELSIIRRKEIGFIFQQFNLLPRMTAHENVALPLFYSKKGKGEDRASTLLESVGLKERTFHRPNELSGGQQQRVAIARSLINNPILLIADEPTGNLDSKSENEIMGILEDLNSNGITVIMVTHEEEIAHKAKRIIKMRDGKIQSDVRNRPVGNHLNNVSKIEEVNNGEHLFSELLGHFKEGIKTLMNNKVRTTLSILGILIGVASVVAMLAIGKGAQKEIESQLSSLGSNLLILRPGGVRVGGVIQDSGTSSKIYQEDINFLKENLLEAKDLSGSVSGKGQLTYLNRNWNSDILGTTPSYPQMRNSIPQIGRFFTESENRSKQRVAIIGTTVVKELFPDKNPMGETIRINKISFQIIGVLPEKGGGGWRDPDDVVIIPLQTAMKRLLGKDSIDSIDIEIKSPELIESAQDKILQLINTRKKIPFSQRENAFQIRNMADIQEALTQSSKTMTLLLSSISAISLLVGGIGIMNIMLVSVTERTKEIGLRKAIGATKKDILIQFLIESVVVSVFGGVLGVGLAWPITKLMSVFAGWATEISLASVLLAFIFSLSIGLIFGIFPAKKASNLHPIEALRYE